MTDSLTARAGAEAEVAHLLHQSPSSLAAALVAGAVTLGVMQQIIRAFGRVEGAMQYLFRSWPTIVELASVYKRLREFEKAIKANIAAEGREGAADAG